MNNLDNIIEDMNNNSKENFFQNEKQKDVFNDLFDMYASNLKLSIDNFKNGQKRLRYNNKWISKKDVFDLLVNEYKLDGDSLDLIDKKQNYKEQNVVCKNEKKDFFGKIKDKFFNYSKKTAMLAGGLLTAFSIFGCGYKGENVDPNSFSDKEIKNVSVLNKDECLDFKNLKLDYNELEKNNFNVSLENLVSDIDLVDETKSKEVISDNLDNLAEDKILTDEKKINEVNTKEELVSKNTEEELINKEKIYEKNYEVKPGDGFYRIASNLDCSPYLLARYNNMTFDDMLHPGDILKVPTSSKDNFSQNKKVDVNYFDLNVLDAKEYVVKKGDALYKISSKFNVPIENILNANDLTLDSIIYPDQKLTIPLNSDNNLTHNIDFFNGDRVDINNPLLVNKIESEAGKIGVTPSVYYALMMAESSYRINVIGDRHIPSGSRSLFAFLKNTYNMHKSDNSVPFYNLTQKNKESLVSNIKTASNLIKYASDYYLSRDVDISKLDENRQVFLIASWWRQGRFYRVDATKENFGVPDNYYELDPGSRRFNRQKRLEEGMRDWNLAQKSLLYASN